MNRDPFDSLRARNPVPPESLPDAPMTVATRITAGRPSLRRGLAIAGATAVAVLAVGSAWLLWSRGGVSETAVEVTTTTLSGTSTTTVPAVVEDAPIVVVYFLDADNSTLVPVARDLNVLDVRPLPDLGPLTLDLLLWGPGAWDAAPLPDPVAAAEAKLTTAIPAGTEVLSLTVAEGIATVDLSTEFAEASPEALAQVVFTLTGGYQEAEAVRFLIEGVPQAVTRPELNIFQPHLVPAATSPGTGVDTVTRRTFSYSLGAGLLQTPPLGGTTGPQYAIMGVARGAEARVGISLHDADGSLLWEEEETFTGCTTDWGACDGTADYVYFGAVLPERLIDYGRWATITAYVVDSAGQEIILASRPVWLAPSVPYTDEPDLPEATTTTMVEITTLAEGAAPWSAAPLAADAVPGVVADTWAAADNRDECAMLFPANPGSLASDAVLHDRYFGGGWGLAWDLPSGPGRWEPGGEYCADCGREAFGVAGTGGEAAGTEDTIWPNHLAWTDGSNAGRGYSHAGYGYEGLSPTGDAGEPLLAYLFIDGQGCMYNVWSFLGEEHLLSLIAQLRFVEGMGGYGLGDLQPFPDDILTGCAAETARDLASFEAALADGPISLQGLCALVGRPDYQTGSGLFIPAYDLADGSRLFLGYAGPQSGDLIYANLASPDGEVRNLLGE